MIKDRQIDRLLETLKKCEQGFVSTSFSSLYKRTQTFVLKCVFASSLIRIVAKR